MSSKLLEKLTNSLSVLDVSLVLVLSLLVPLTIVQPQTAHAATLPAYRYTKTFDTSSGSAQGNSVATDSSGNVYVAGQFQGTVVFDGPGGSDTVTSANTNGFLTKYNSNGSYAWTRTFDASASGAFAESESVATDGNGNVYVAGDFFGTVVFDGPGGSDSQNGGTNDDSYLTKYSTNGSYAFTKTFDVSASGASFAFNIGVTTDSGNNVYVTGAYGGTVVFDGAGGSDSRNGGSSGSSYVTKYNANGSYAFTKASDASAGGAFAQGNSVAVDSNGNIYVAGQFQGTVVFDGTGGSDSQNGGANDDSYLTKYNANGSYVFTKTFDVSASGAFAQDKSVATDSSGNAYVTGSFSGTVIFDGTGGSDSQDGGPNADSFLTKYNANGSYAFTKSFDVTAGGSSARGAGVTTDSSGNIYETGSFSGTVIFDGPGGSDSQNGPALDSFLTKYNANGSYAFTKSFDTSVSSPTVDSKGVATDSSGNVYLAGRFQGTVGFDGTGGSDIQTSANTDSFLTSFQVSIPGQPSSPAAPTSAPVPGAPNTGYGVFRATPLRTLAAYGLASLGLLGLATVVGRRARQSLRKPE